MSLSDEAAMTPAMMVQHLQQLAENVRRLEQQQGQNATEAEKALTKQQIQAQLTWFKTKFASMEMRAMLGNIFGHETVRQFEDQYKTQSINTKMHNSIKRNANQYTSS